MKRYDKEFKKEIIRKYMEGRTVAGLSRETGVSEGVIHKWKNALVRADDGEADKEKLAMRKKIRRHSAIGGKIPEFEKQLRKLAAQGCGNAGKPQSGLSRIPTATATRL